MDIFGGAGNNVRAMSETRESELIGRMKASRCPFVFGTWAIWPRLRGQYLFPCQRIRRLLSYSVDPLLGCNSYENNN